ncbi:MAG: hypothetical protein HRS57_03300 [Mycoplasmataceae bacterium]|nr:hypothetical protein [Mycoplasmataceae bacterium]
MKRFKLWFYTINKTLLFSWTFAILAVNSVTIALIFALPWSMSSDKVTQESENISDIFDDIDTIGTDPFLDAGFLSSSSTSQETYYVITSEGYLYTWGWNLNGELGQGVEDEYVFYPTFVNLDGSYYDANGNGIRDYNELDTITEGDKVSEIKHINWDQTNSSAVMAISQEGYLYMWGDSTILPNRDIPEYKYSSSKTKVNMNNITSPQFVNLDKSYETDDLGNEITEVARDIDDIPYKDSSNNIIDIRIPTKTEGDKVKDAEIWYSSRDKYGGTIISESGELYGWGTNIDKIIDSSKGESYIYNELTPITFTDSYTGLKYEDVDVRSNGSGANIVALDTNGKLYAWGNSTIIPGSSSIGNRYLINLPSTSANVTSFIFNRTLDALFIIDSDGFLYSIGNDSNGQSAQGCRPGGASSSSLYKVDLDCNTAYDDNDKVKYVSTADHSGFLVSEDDYLYSFGRNNHGQGGMGSKYVLHKPHIVDFDLDGTTGDDPLGDPDDKVSIASNGNPNTLAAVTQNGKLYMAGDNEEAHAILPDTSDDALVASEVTYATHVNFVEHEEGEKYTNVSIWRKGGVATSDYLNLYMWGSYDSNDSWTVENLRYVNKITSEDFVNNAVHLI